MPDRFGRICNVLEFVQDKARNQQGGLEKTGGGDIRDAPVDDDAGIQQDSPFFGGRNRSGSGKLGAKHREQIILAHHEEGYAQIAEENCADERKKIPERRGQKR